MAYDYLEDKDVVQGIVETDEAIKKALSEEQIDEKKIFKLRYRQMLQGLYLQNVGNIKM